MPISQPFIGMLNPWTYQSQNPYSQMMPIPTCQPFLNSMFNPSMFKALPQQASPFSYGAFPQTLSVAPSYSSIPMSHSMSTNPSMYLQAQPTFGVGELRDNYLETRQKQRERKRVQKLEEKLRRFS